jgi:hypothetical protein
MSFFDFRIDISMPNKPHNHISKVLPRNGDQSWTFQCNFLRLLAIALLFWQATANRPSRSRNVNYANGQTDRIVVPYLLSSARPAATATEQWGLEEERADFGAPRDGIHQIVSRFLERFCYMCPLLFFCVFPS